jgi:hypothetical protein
MRSCILPADPFSKQVSVAGATVPQSVLRYMVQASVTCFPHLKALSFIKDIFASFKHMTFCVTRRGTEKSHEKSHS